MHFSLAVVFQFYIIQVRLRGLGYVKWDTKKNNTSGYPFPRLLAAESRPLNYNTQSVPEHEPDVLQ